MAMSAAEIMSMHSVSMCQSYGKASECAPALNSVSSAECMAMSVAKIMSMQSDRTSRNCSLVSPLNMFMSLCITAGRDKPTVSPVLSGPVGLPSVGRRRRTPAQGGDTDAVESNIKTLLSHLVTRKFKFPTNSLRTHRGLDTDTVELTVKTLSSHLVTPEFKSTVNSLRTLYARVEPKTRLHTRRSASD
eukprot:1186959-Prorocentrum_minimum.AAC.3